uniref:FERM domain-containing protein n=1 Tax=Oncorhynchus mykiss TaxID=8022 RepID=A0A8C7T016_ONCMY
MSVSTTKQERTLCVLLPNKEQLDITVGVKSTGQDVFNQVSELLGIKELHFFGLTVVKDNEHIFLDMEDKLTKYFPKEWKQDSGKGLQKRSLPLVLCLKVQYYVENGRLICERKARRLYFSDLRERVLRSECRQQEEVYFQLAGYALQADLEDHPLPGKNQGGTRYFQPKEYFPPWIVAKRGVDYLLCHGPKVHKELWGMTPRDAILYFIKEACRLEDVPVTFYRLQKDKKEERGTALLGLTLRGMQLYQEADNIRQLLYDFPWSNVGRLTFLGKKFEIQPDGLPSARKLVYYTGSPFRSRHLLLHLSNSHRLYLSLQPALKHLRQLEDSEEKKRYRESYISDDLDLDHPGGSEGGSPGLSRHSTSSSGIEADRDATRQHSSISMEMASMEEETDKARTDEEEWQEEGEVSVDDPEEMLRLAELMEGVSVDRPVTLQFESHMPPNSCILKLNVSVKWSPNTCFYQSLDDVRLFPPPAPLGTTLPPDSSHSYTFGLPLPDSQCDAKSPPGCNNGGYYLPLHCPAKGTFYGHRSMNCLSLDLLGDEQLLEFIL